MKNLVFSFFLCIFGLSCGEKVLLSPQIYYYYQDKELVGRIPFSNIQYQYAFMQRLKYTGYDCNRQCSECQSDSLVFKAVTTRGLFVEIRRK